MPTIKLVAERTATGRVHEIYDSPLVSAHNVSKELSTSDWRSVIHSAVKMDLAPASKRNVVVMASMIACTVHVPLQRLSSCAVVALMRFHFTCS